MPNIQGFLRQTATLRRKQPLTSDWGEDNFSEPTTIPCRRSDQVKQIRSKGANKLLSTTKFLTTEEIKTGDELDGLIILAVETIRGVDGKAIGYKSFPVPPAGFADF